MGLQRTLSKKTNEVNTMEINWLNIITTIAAVLLGGLSWYLKISATGAKMKQAVEETIKELTAKANDYIVEAEEVYVDATKAGGQKFEYVVDALMKLIPDQIEVFITRDMVSGIVQGAFESIEKYAQTQLDEYLNKKVPL